MIGAPRQREFLDRLGAMPLAYQPGTDWRYSVSTDVLGHLVSVISGLSLADFLDQRIFQPLGMVDTAFHVPPSPGPAFSSRHASARLSRCIWSQLM